MGQAKARHPAFPDRFFNVGFALDPKGEGILKHHKLATLYPVEHSVTRHDVWDRWIELYGRNLDAFFPVADTEIGRLAVLMANEGSYPENARGLALNGAEVVYRASYPHPHTGNDFFEIQNRARALDNNFYVVAPNLATYYLEQDSDLPIDTFGGQSMIVDYKGRIVGQLAAVHLAPHAARAVLAVGVPPARTRPARRQGRLAPWQALPDESGLGRAAGHAGNRQDGPGAGGGARAGLAGAR